MKAQNRLRRIFIYVTLILGAVLTLLPIWYMVITSLKPNAQVYEMPPRMWPRELTLSNYGEALSKANFDVYFRNSAVVAVATVVLTLLISAMMAYAFARLKFPFKEPIFYLLLLGMMVPPVMLIIPQFIVARSLELTNTLPGLFLVYTTMNLAMQTFLLRGVFEGIPNDLVEAALIDGGSNWTIFRHVILPLSGPALAVVVINAFLYSWEEFAWANVAVTKDPFRTVPIGIAFFQSQHLTLWGQVFAASTLAMIPVVMVFLLFQRHFVRGISTTGLKG